MPTNYALIWDDPKDRLYETGVDRAVLYKQDSNGEYPKGVAWNGVTGITESTSGADETALWADNIKYLSLRSAETIGGTLECYTYPNEWKECDGRREMATGVEVSQQVRKPFGLAYRTILGNDIEDNDYSYKLHLFYNLTASPSERGYSSVNDSPEALSFSFELTSTPIPMPNGLKASALITIDASKADPTKLAALESILYGNAGTATYTETSDETPQAGVTYYTRSGAGTSESPYVYTVFTGSTFDAQTTYYEKEYVGAVDPRLPLPQEVHDIFAAQG